jgi:hypothetical protein
LIAALHPDDVVIGGGNEKKLKILPPGCRAGNNKNAFLGGFRLWQGADSKDELWARDGELPAKDSVVEGRNA